MPKDTKTLGNNKARACESLGFVHKKRLCQRFDTTSFCFSQARKKRQNITVRGGAKGEDKRWSENLHQFRVFITDLQCFAYQENADGLLLLSNEKL